MHVLRLDTHLLLRQQKVLNTHLKQILHGHGVQRRMNSVDNFFVFLRLLFLAVLLLYVT